MTILVIDNYDSFTFNLVHYLAELGAETIVVRNDSLSTQDAMGMRPEAILLSPGPCTPNEAGICLALIEAAAETKTPLFGVCLGHQALGQAFGGIVERAPQVMHGKVSEITHDGSGVFAGKFPLQTALGATDMLGKRVGDELQAIGYAGKLPVGGRPVGAYFEAPIEQGPILEAQDKVIGVVTGSLGLRWYDVTVSGMEMHAGPTPMSVRQDALFAATHLMQEVVHIALDHQPHGRRF